MRSTYPFVLTLILFCSLNVAHGQVVNSIANGSATDPAIWDCACIPGVLNDVVVNHSVTLSSSAEYNSLRIMNGADLTTNTSGNTRVNNDLVIEAGGVLVNNRRLDIYGNYTVNGAHGGTSHIRIRGAGNILSGVPTGYISNTAKLMLMDGEKTIAAGSSLTKNSGRTQVFAGVTVHNYGAFQGGRFIGQSGALWVNHSGSWLAVRTAWRNQVALDAQSTGNIVVFNRVGTDNQIIASTVNGIYWDLEILGNDLNSRKRLQNDIVVLDDLTIGTSTFDPRRAGVDRNIEIHGDWNNVSGDFARRTAQVTFVADIGTQILHSGQERFYDLVISGADTVTLKADINVSNSLTINGVLDVDGVMSNNITLRGDLDVNGTLIPRNGDVSFVNNGAKNVNGQLDLYDLSINTPGNVTLQSGVHSIKGTLSLMNGNLETNGSLTLISDASGTARINEVTGGTMTGDVTVQRYIDAGATNWRFLSSPVSGNTLADWDDDFITSGFAGSDFPSFPFTSIYSFDESQPGTSSDGFVPAASISDPINIGEGYWVWCGDSLGGTAPFTIDVKGPANIGTQALPIQFTTVSGPTNDGWCMVGNPFASTIDWDDPSWTKTNLDDAIYIWDPDNQQFASYVNGIGTNGGSPFIASSQAFWVKANAPSPVLDVPESAKSVIDASFKSNYFVDGVTLLLSGNGYGDETVIRTVPGATDFFDPTLDALKMSSTNSTVPNISSQILGPVDMAINSLPVINSDISIPIRATTGTTGSYTIKATGVFGSFANSCIVLEDLYTGTQTAIYQGVTYNFTLSDTTDLPRFILHVGVPVQNEVFNASCAGTSDGSAIITGAGNGPWDYIWYDDQGTVLQTSSAMNTPGLISDLDVGSYSVQVNTGGSCPSVTIPFEVEEPEVLNVVATVSNAFCTSSADGAIEIDVSGGTAPYLFTWSNGSQSEDQIELTPGTYSVNIEDMNHCMQDLSFEVEHGFEVTAAFTTATTEVYLSNGAEVMFNNTSNDANEFRWNFGDGSPIEFGTNAVHAYTEAGVYTVNLRALNMDCFDDMTTDITVIDNVTGINEVSGIDGLSIVQNEQGVFLVIAMAEPTDLIIQVFNTLGQEITESRSGKFLNDRVELTSGPVGSVMLISVTNEGNGEIFSQKVLRQ